MRPTAAQENPARSSGNGDPGRTGREQPRPAPSFCLHLQRWCQGQPRGGPCNKLLRLPSSKDSSPSLPASPPPRSCLCVTDSLSLLSAHGSLSCPARTGSQGSALPVWLVEILGPRMGKGSTVSGGLVSCTKMVCSLPGWH